MELQLYPFSSVTEEARKSMPLFCDLQAFVQFVEFMYIRFKVDFKVDIKLYHPLLENRTAEQLVFSQYLPHHAVVVYSIKSAAPTRPDPLGKLGYVTFLHTANYTNKIINITKK